MPSEGTWKRRSIEPTYDATEIGPAYRLTTHVNGRKIEDSAQPDPFITTFITLGWRDCLRALFRKRQVQLMLSADSERVEDVLELNADYLGERGSTRRQEWDQQLEEALKAVPDAK